MPIYRRVRPALDILDEAEHAVDELQKQPAGRLRISSTVEGGQFVLGPIMAEFLKRHPAVEMQIELTDRHVDLIAEGFDLALRADQLADSGLISRRLGSLGPFQLYASPEYLSRRSAPHTPENLADHDCLIMTSQLAPTLWEFTRGKKKVHIDVRARAEANSFVVLRDLAVAGLGIARLPPYIAAGVRKPGSLRTVLEQFVPSPIPWHAVYPSSRHLSPKIRALVDLLLEQFPDTAPS